MGTYRRVCLPVDSTSVFAKFAHEIYSFLVLAPLVATTALLKSIVFPIAHHLGSSSDPKQVGRSVSRVYFCNVVGSTFGPLVTGFLLLDLMSLQMTSYLWHRSRWR